MSVGLVGEEGGRNYGRWDEDVGGSFVFDFGWCWFFYCEGFGGRCFWLLFVWFVV